MTIFPCASCAGGRGFRKFALLPLLPLPLPPFPSRGRGGGHDAHPLPPNRPLGLSERHVEAKPLVEQLHPPLMHFLLLCSPLFLLLLLLQLGLEEELHRAGVSTVSAGVSARIGLG